MADYPGEANHSRCLVHIVNLVVKIILRQFDVSKKKEKQNEPDVSNGPELAKDSNGDEDMIPVMSAGSSNPKTTHKNQLRCFKP
jgi:hypothetical protein